MFTKRMFAPIFYVCIFIILLWHACAHAQPNYGIYTSIIHAYEKEFGKLTAKKFKGMELYDVWGVPFVQLTDLNGDGIDELLLVRMYDGPKEYEVFSAENHKRNILHIFTLVKGHDLEHVGSFPLLHEDLALTVQLATMEGKKYILSGHAYDAMDWRKTLWELTSDDSVLKFVQVKSFASQFNTHSTEGVDYSIDGKIVNKATFTPLYEAWMKNIHTQSISNITAQKMEELKLYINKEKQKLAKYPPMDNFSSSALFNKGRFLMVEDMPNNEQEYIYYTYFQTLINDDFTTLKTITIPIEDPLWNIKAEERQERVAQKSFIPGYIIEKMNTIPAEEVGHQSLILAEEAMPILQQLNLHEHVFVRAVVNEVKDFSITHFAPQACYGTYNFWALVGRATPTSPWRIYAEFSDHTLYPHMHANAFAVHFLGHMEDWKELHEYSPPLHTLYTPEELASLDHKDFNGNETYIVRNKFHAPTDIYEAIIAPDGNIQSGRLLHSYKAGELMYFTCNFSETQPNVLLRYKTRYGATYDYIPSLNLKDGTVEYGPYGEAERAKEKRRSSYRVY